MSKSSLRQLMNQVLPGRRWDRQGRQPGRAVGRKGRPRLLAVEPIEDRCLLSTLQAISLPPTSPPPSDTAAGASIAPSVSGDGRYVAFQSTAPNLVAGQTGAAEANIFLLDRQTGTMTLVSHLPGSATAAPTSGGASTHPLISRDGRYVVYDSAAPELAGLPASGIPEAAVVVCNVATGQNTLVSHNSVSLLTPADQPSSVDAVSGDGTYIVFESGATNPIANLIQIRPGDLSPPLNLYVYNQVTGTMLLVNHAYGSPNITSERAVFPGASVADDGTVAFTVAGPPLTNPITTAYLGTGDVYLYSPGTQENQVISTSPNPNFGDTETYAAGFCSGNPLISSDGTTVAYVSATNIVLNQVSGNTDPGAENVFRYSRATGTTTLVSGAGGSATVTGNLDSGANGFGVAMSRNGQFIAFASKATNLVSGQSGAVGNIFLYNANSQTLSLVSGVNGSPTIGAGGVPDLSLGGRPNGVADPITGGTTPVLSVSDDGSLVAYVSQAGSIVPGQTGPAATDNVFLYRATTRQSTLVTGVDGSATAGGSAESGFPVLSDDGSLLAFHTLTYNLNSGLFDGNGVADVFTTVQGAAGTTLVSREAFLVQAPGDSFSASVSADGRYTVFTSTATNLVPNQATVNGYQNIFLFDKQTGIVALVNHAPGLPNTTGDGGLVFHQPTNQRPPGYLLPAISADGRFIAFTSFDDNLVANETLPAGATGQSASVYLYNVQTGQITLVNHEPNNPAGIRQIPAFGAAVSADGRFVAYVYGDPASGPEFSEGAINLYDRVLDTTTVVLASQSSSSSVGTGSSPALSDDGRYVVYQSAGNVYLFDDNSGSTTLVSHASSSPTTAADGASSAPVLSHDGSTVAFVSQATDLVSGQTASAAAGLSNVFLYANDGSGAVSLVSGVNGSATLSANGNSDRPAIDTDGSYVAYRSAATNLVNGQSGRAGSNIFEFNSQTGTQTLVSSVAGTSTVTAGGSTEPVLDDDGHLVSYVSTAASLVPGQSGPTGVKNVFIWLRQTGANILASGQDGSPTVAGDADSDFPLLTRDSFPGFSSKARLLPGVSGSSVAYINTLVAVSLSPNTVALGSAAGSLVGELRVSSLLAGQYLPPVYSLPGGEASNGLFALGGTSGGAAPLLNEFQASAAQTYQVQVHVNVGFGDDPVLLQVAVTPSSGGGSGGGGGSGSGSAGGGGGGGNGGGAGGGTITARLVAVRVSKKKTRLMVELFDAATGVETEAFAAPFQGPGYKHVQVSVRGNQVVVTARQGKKTLTRTYPA